MPATELSRAFLAGRELRGEDHSLISCELTRGATHLTHFLAHDHGALHVRTPVDHHSALFVFRERQRGLERGLHRAAAAQRAAPVVDPRREPELEGIADMPRVGKRTARANMCDELEHRLAVAILEVLSTEPVAIQMQQQRALGGRDGRNGLRRVRCASQKSRTRAAAGNRSCPSGRHTPMSLAAAIRPPLNFMPASVFG